MFPAFFAKVNQHGRADHRHDRAGRRADAAGAVDDLADAERAVQRARQPRGRHQRHSLHHRAVGADGDDEDGARSPRTSTRATSSSPWSRWLYSVFALYASGQGRGARRHARDRHRLHHLGLHRAALQPAVDGDGREPLARCSPSRVGTSHDARTGSGRSARAAQPSLVVLGAVRRRRRPTQRRRSHQGDGPHPLRLSSPMRRRSRSRRTAARRTAMQWSSARGMAEDIKRDLALPGLTIDWVPLACRTSA